AHAAPAVPTATGTISPTATATATATTAAPTATGTVTPAATSTAVGPTATGTISSTSTMTVTPTPTGTQTGTGGCPAGWTCADIGTTGAAGSESLSSGTWTVRGSGGDIWTTGDQFHFDWQTLGGNGSASTRVISQTNTNAWAKAGVMLRGSTAPSSPFYAILVTPGNGITVQYRATSGAAAVKAAQPAGAVPVYLKVTRAGTAFTAYTSSNGVSWTLVPGSTITLSGLTGTLLAGLAVTSHNAGTICTVTFDTVAVG
ncbi:MAG: hypothetical protein JWO42_2284, partial [Chloroflexi bacterium]|nr:hypothetical protein [Chloroflexota bacterium]